MANYTVKRVKHATLTAKAVDAVRFTANPGTVEVLNRSGTAWLYFAADGTTPAVQADDAYVVGPGSALQVPLDATDTVRLICDTAAPYTVTAS